MRVEEIGLAEWKDALPNEGYSAFHAPEALAVIDEHATAEMRLFAGYNGGEPIALFPMYVRDESIGRLALSPPPGFGIRGLGPILMPKSPKRAKREKINGEFTQRIIDVVGADQASTLFLVTCDAEFRDPRPYEWAGFNVETKYTYRLDLGSTTREALIDSFSRSLRREIRNTAEGVTIRKGGRADLRDVYEATQARYEEQGKRFGPSYDFVVDVVSSLEGRAEVYVAESAAGEFLSGVVVVYSNDTAYFWIGGIRRTEVANSVNGKLHWRVIEDVFEDPSKESIGTYDFFTANNRNIARFKRKFGGRLEPYYRIESKSLPMTIAKRAYRLKRDLL